MFPITVKPFYTTDFLAAMGLIFILLLNLVLGFFVFVRQPKNRINQIFLGLSISLTGWSLATLVLNEFRTTNSARMTFFSAIFIGWFLVFFTYYFPKKRDIKLYERLIHHLLALVLLTLSFSDLIIIDIQALPVGFKGIHGPFFAPFIILFGYLFFRSFINLWISNKTANTQEKQQVVVFLTGWIIGAILAFTTNLILPFFGVFVGIKIGPLFSFIVVAFTAYAITKYKMMNIKTVAAGIFIAALLIAAFTDIFSSESYYEYIFRIILFIFVLILSLLLNKSIHNEVHRREQMEQLSKELAQANEKLKQLDQAKTDFLSMASHQLRSPLTVVRLGTGALLDGTFGPMKNPKQIDALNRMQESAVRLINLIGDYLNVSRIELGKMKYDFKKQDLCKLVADIVEEYQPRAREKGLKLEFVGVGAHSREIATAPRPRGLAMTKKEEERKGKPLTPALSRGERGIVPPVTFDEEKMRHVLVNLIDNAIKYTNKGRIEVGCAVADGLDMRRPDPRSDGGMTSRDQWVKVSVQDTGAGLDADDMAVLFKKFRRVESGKLRMREGEPVEGSGLGLHVAKMFVEKHGGKIWAESPGHGQGSTFCFALPVSGPPPLSEEEQGESGSGKGVEMPRY